MIENFNLEKRIKEANPTLYDISYEPDTTSWNFRLTTKRFTDPETGTVIMPTWPYLMPGFLGSFQNTSDEIQNDLTQSRGEYESTQRHELLHKKGHREYMTRYLNGEINDAHYN